MNTFWSFLTLSLLNGCGDHHHYQMCQFCEVQVQCCALRPFNTLMSICLSCDHLPLLTKNKFHFFSPIATNFSLPTKISVKLMQKLCYPVISSNINIIIDFLPDAGFVQQVYCKVLERKGHLYEIQMLIQKATKRQELEWSQNISIVFLIPILVQFSLVMTRPEASH